MRRTFATLAACSSIALLAACGGGSDMAALDQGKTKDAQLKVEDLPESGWTAGSVSSHTATPSSTSTTSKPNPLETMKGISDDCKAALAPLNSLDQLNSGKAETESNFTKGKERLTTVVAVYDSFPEQFNQLADLPKKCPEAKIEESGVTATMKFSSPSYSTADSNGFSATFDAMGQKQAMDMVWAKRGQNVIIATMTGNDASRNHDFLQKVIDKQDEKLKSVAK